MNQNFSKSKILREASKLEHFQWRSKTLGFTNLGGGGGVKVLDLLKV